ncbi:hypothetical protein ABW21_db0209781 [Orbilia brochopaga]|nr:hypothetical protein ABW21_db0209781 [Drechslerella brochopaga]
MDPETASIRSMRSTAPSYVSQVPPNYAHASAISAPPPYSSDGRLPPYTRPLAGPRDRYDVHQAAGPLGPRALSSFPLSPVSNLPPVALIAPGSRTTQSRQYEAVAARRHAKIVSAAFDSLDPPQRRNKRRGSRLPFQDFSSLHPAPSTPRALVHSTAELFLCTCGRPNHRRVTGEEWLDTNFSRQNHAHDLSLEEPPSATESLQQENIADSSAQDCISLASGSSATESAEEHGAECQRSFEQDLLDAESKSWDFMLSQMAG